MPSDEQDKAGVIAPPPLIYLGALIFGLLLSRRFPIPFLPRRMARGLGWPLLGGAQRSSRSTYRTDRAELYPHDLPFGGCSSTRPALLSKATP